MFGYPKLAGSLSRMLLPFSSSWAVCLIGSHSAFKLDYATILLGWCIWEHVKQTGLSVQHARNPYMVLHTCAYCLVMFSPNSNVSQQKMCWWKLCKLQAPVCPFVSILTVSNSRCILLIISCRNVEVELELYLSSRMVYASPDKQCQFNPSRQRWHRTAPFSSYITQAMVKIPSYWLTTLSLLVEQVYLSSKDSQTLLAPRTRPDLNRHCTRTCTVAGFARIILV